MIPANAGKVADAPGVDSGRTADADRRMIPHADACLYNSGLRREIGRLRSHDWFPADPLTRNAG